MQGPIAQALLLTCAGNASLQGRELAGFWPDASIFMFSKRCDFRLLDAQGDTPVATDPLEWFETLRASSRGLRLHHAQRVRQPSQDLAVEDRMLVGFVGGGPAWLIETVGEGSSAFWQGFDSLGDRNDANRKIWLTTYLRGALTPAQNLTPEQDLAPSSLGDAGDELEAALVDIEALAKRMKFGDWDRVFAAARAALHALPARPHFYTADFDRYAGFNDAQQRLLGAVLGAWVFGAMGSWNDMVPDAEFSAEYELLSERLFQTLNNSICALANSTYLS